MDDFQNRGEPYRQMFGIDGSAGDAQDKPHPFVPDSPSGPCVACGLARSYRKHTEDWSAPVDGDRYRDDHECNWPGGDCWCP